MPIIKEKDKYNAKGDTPRSRALNLQSDAINYNNQLSTAKKQELATEQARINSNTSTSVTTRATVGTINNSRIYGYTIPKISTGYNIFTLSPGHSIKSIIINHWVSSGATSIISLYWSTRPPEQLTLTGTEVSGTLTATPKGSLHRLFTDTFASEMTLTLDPSNIGYFEKFNVPVYFYAAVSAMGPEITIIYSSGDTV